MVPVDYPAQERNRNTISSTPATTYSWLPACINRKLLPFKLHYFLFIAGEAGVGPYIAVVGRRNGIGPATMAVIFAIMPLTAVVFKPVCGFIIDRTRNVTAVILVLQVLCTIFYGIAFFCPSAISDGATYHGHLSCPPGAFDVTGTSGSERCHSSGSGSLFCVLSTEKRLWEGVSVSITMDGNIVLANGSEPCKDLRNNESLANDFLVVPGDMKCSCDAALYHNPNFWIYAVSAILGFALAAALNNVGDAAVSNALGSDIEVFGRQRLFGTLSYGMTSPLIGYLVDVASSENFTDYRPCFYVFASAMLLDMILILSVPRMRVAEVSVNFFKDIAQLLSSPEILLFTFFTFLAGSLMGFLNAFETWFLEDLGTPTYLIGLTKTIQCFGAEPVLFFLSTYILRKIGYFYSYSVAFVLFACKAIGYSFLQDVWGSLAVNIVGGAIFPMVYATMAVFAKKKARPGTAASMVCILGANYDGVGSAAGSLVGGLSVDKIGASLTFRYIGFSSVAAALLSALCYLLLRCTADHEYDITPEKPEPSTISGSTCGPPRYSPKLEHETLVESSSKL
ncbi:hypothetical protein HPB52_004433 [Rhipicephalus sanguineus]|uniref:Major facilitator superfamily associated domain-containing protein n=1 Tax=Rhipicephalus sanguineus TaxID=34632 RepID=A0A9D4PN10_RHISA|nr:hypothetical protein HPB52_004433 [Rhipicephalus sanguineus]